MMKEYFLIRSKDSVMKYLINLTFYFGKKLSWFQSLFYVLFVTNITALINHARTNAETDIFVFYIVNIGILLLGLFAVTRLMDRWGFYLDEHKKLSLDENFKVFYSKRQGLWDRVYHISFYTLLTVSIIMLGCTLKRDLNSPDKTQEMSNAVRTIEKNTKLILSKSNETKRLTEEKKVLQDSIAILNTKIEKQTLVIDSLERKK